jgi:hypothetical protein
MSGVFVGRLRREREQLRERGHLQEEVRRRQRRRQRLGIRITGSEPRRNLLTSIGNWDLSSSGDAILLQRRDGKM